MCSSPLTYRFYLALFFAIALIFTSMAIPYYNAGEETSIILSEEETENECNNSRTILEEEIHPVVSLQLSLTENAYILLSVNSYRSLVYKIVYLTVSSPPPDFLS